MADLFSSSGFPATLALAAANGQLPAMAQLLIVGLEFVAPLLYSWLTFDSNVEKMAGRFDDLGQEEFEFIVVGAGSAGSVVTNRLSEFHRVLLLEAGGTPHPALRIPVMTYFLHGIGAIDWKWQTVPQKSACFGLKNNVSFWPAGRGLGGSSTINGMIYFRGNVQGFDTVANLTGNMAWSTSNMLTIFKSIEDYNGYFNEARGHGHGGRLSIEKSHLHPCSVQLLRAGEELGYRIRDPNSNGPITEGFAPMDFYLKNGRRWSAFDGYLRDILEDRKTLTVRKYATVTKVLLDDRNRAYGVEYVQDGVVRQSRASKEVILSASSIQSAKLLMLSGIGPRDHLEELGIKVKVDSPVGQVLQDKYGALVGPFVSAPRTSFLRERDINMQSVVEWLTAGTGPIQCSRSEATYTWSSSFAKRDGYGGFPDLHTYFLAWSIDERYEREMSSAFNFDKVPLQRYFGRVKGQDSFLQMVTLNKVFGTGTLKLRSKDPFAQPLLDPKYLQHPRDTEALVEGIKFAVNLVENTTAFQEINARLVPIPFPGCEKHVFKSDSYFECLARHTTVTAYKYSATTPIGRDASDPEAVVDSELRVMGVKGLRVIDGSVLQVRHLSVNHVSIQGMAELASRFVLNYWRRHKGHGLTSVGSGVTVNDHENNIIR